ncbi:MAG: FAD-dependent oxidoreductase [Bacteroidota bacterium]
MRTLFTFLLTLVILNSSCSRQQIHQLEADVCIIGAGSAGIGAALAASRSGADVILVEKEEKVGGTSVQSYVNTWEPGPGCSYANEIYHRLPPGAKGVAKQVHSYDRDEPYGLSLVSPQLSYNLSLRRSDLDVKTETANVVFDVNEFDHTVRQMLEETGRCKLLLNTKFVNANVTNNEIKTIEAISSSGQKYQVSAKVFIDCTGGAFVCRNAGCETMLGEEPRSKFGEPSAPENPSNSLNAISLCYQIKPLKTPSVSDTLKKPEPDYDVVAHVTGPVGPDQKLTVNPLGIIDGKSIIDQPPDELYEKAKNLVDKHWSKLHTYPHFKEYEFDSYAPMLGIRESYRIVCRYVLTQNDLLSGLPKQKHEDIITVADHPMDLHGENSSLKLLKEAYGVPYRSLVPKGFDNLLVAGRGAGFSHIAASSCRLSRTMMSLGHAAGFAAWLSASEERAVWDVPVKRVQEEMNLKLRPKKDLNADPLPIK